jgi:hypothetical protein
VYARGIYGLHMCMCYGGLLCRHIRGFVFGMIVIVSYIFCWLRLGVWRGFGLVNFVGCLGNCWLWG